MKSANPTELLNVQSNAEESQNKENSSNEELVYSQQYKDSGLVVRGDAENGYFVTAGQYIVSPLYESPDEAFERIENRDYLILMGIIDAMILFSKTNNKD